MEWLSQNWIPLAVGIAFIFLMRRGGMCCGSHQKPHRDAAHDTETSVPTTKVEKR